jgi:RecA/RadA recombinase
MGSSSTSRRAATESRRGVIVEFTGVPGSGKSTLSSHALARARERGLEVVEGRAIRPVYLQAGPMAWFVRHLLPFTSFDHRRRRFYDQIELPLLLPRFAARHPRGWRLLRAELERIRGETPEEHERIERWMEREIRHFVMARARSSRLDLILCDEGIAHRCITLFASSRPELERTRLRRFLRCWALPDVVVQVRASSERCLERTRSRYVPKRVRGKGDAALRAFLGACATVGDEIAQEARRRGLPALEIDNEHASVEEFLGSPQCAALLDQLLHPRRGRIRGATRCGA